MVQHPNYIPPHGGLATNRYDFQHHIDGTAFRHNADQIDVDPAVVIGGTPYTDVAATLAALSGSIVHGKSDGFITVGDGYDTWHNANGTTNYDNTIPALDLLLNSIFNPMIAHTTVPAGYERIQRGGIVLIKAGTYIIRNTVNVPPGIILLGEGYGTKIVNATSLDISSLPPTPKLSPTPLPLFNIIADDERSVDDAAVDSNLFMFARETVICNMVIADNFVEDTVLGDIYYKLPQNDAGNTPLIKQLSGSNLTLENIKFLGRITFSSGIIVSAATTYAIQLDTTIPVSNGTILRVSNCTIDGFSQPISFKNTAGSNDYLKINNSRIRSYGYLNGNNSLATDNCIIKVNDSNTDISNNYLYGNSNVVSVGLLSDGYTTTIPNLHGRGKILLSGNNIEIQKTNNSVNNTFKIFDSTLGLDGYISSMVFGNNFDDKFVIGIDKVSSSTLPITVQSSSLSINQKLLLTGNSATVSGTINLTGNENVVLADATSATVNINLAATSAGQILIIKDAKGQAAINSINIIPHGTDKIEGLNTTKSIIQGWGSITLFGVSDGWVMI